MDELRRFVDAGLARPARLDVADLPEPAPGPALSAEVIAAGDAERY